MRHTPLDKYVLGNEGCSQRLQSVRVERAREWFELLSPLTSGFGLHSEILLSFLFSLPFPPLYLLLPSFLSCFAFSPFAAWWVFPSTAFFSLPLSRFKRSFPLSLACSINLLFISLLFIPFRSSLPFLSSISPSLSVFWTVSISFVTRQTFLFFSPVSQTQAQQSDHRGLGAQILCHPAEGAHGWHPRWEHR